MIELLNKPKIDNSWKRTGIDPVLITKEVEIFVSKHKKFKNQPVSICFTDNHFSSFVCILKTKKEKLVLKIPLHKKRFEGESQFLKIWKRSGVPTPKIVEEGFIKKRPYILMKYVEEKTLLEKFTEKQALDKKIFYKMGKTLCKMHKVKAQGFGFVIKGKPEFDSFDNWVFDNKYIDKKVKYIRKRGILEEEKHGSLSYAIKLLTKNASKSNKSTYCHNDFYLNNIFATTPLTVIDPNPTCNYPIFDIAQTIERIVIVNINVDASVEQFLQGYFGGKKFNRELLQSAILLNSYIKLAYWHKINKNKRIELLKKYLERTKDFLANP